MHTPPNDIILTSFFEELTKLEMNTSVRMFNTHLILFILKCVHANVGYHKLVNKKKKSQLPLNYDLCS